MTTTALVLALTWPRPVVLVDADPGGGSQVLAGFLHGITLPGLSELVLAHHHRQLAVELPLRLAALAGSQARFLPGVRSPRQAPVLAGVWDELLEALRGMEAAEGVDVIVDAGRLGLLGSPEPLLAEADVLLVLAGSGLPELAAVQAWNGWLRQCSPNVRLALVGEGRPYSVAEAAHSLGIKAVGRVVWDPRAARQWSHGETGMERVSRGVPRSPLRSSIIELGEGLRAASVPAASAVLEARA